MQLLRKLAFPISLVYGLVVYLRNYLYDIGFLKSNSYSTPTICIGNLSVGGTGKTPMIEFLIAALQVKNKIAVLSRGYGRKSNGFLIADKNTTVKTLGDEPFQIFKKFPNITVAVDTDRCNGISILENIIKPDVILLDDAFQHRKVKAKLNILLTTFNNLYVSDWYLPTGNLRDARNQAKRAQLIIVTKCPETLSLEKQQKIINRLKPKNGQEVLFATLAYDQFLKGQDKEMQLSDLGNKKVTLVTGIANPVPLCNYLIKKDVIFNHLKYRDHHFFTDTEIAYFNTKEIILSTEKDYVRLKGKVKNLYYIGIQHQFLGNENELLLDKLNTFI